MVALTTLSAELEKTNAAELSHVTDIKAHIVERALFHGAPPQVALAIAEGESRYNPDATGDTQPMKDGVPAYARGLWQITRKFHPEIPDACAFDVRCSTEWAMPLIKDEQKCKKEWTVCKSIPSASWRSPS